MRNLERHMRVLFHQEDRRAVTIELGNNVENLRNDQWRKTERRFIHQQHARPRHQRPRDRKHLLFAARQRAGELLPALLEPRKPCIHAFDVSIDLGLVTALVGTGEQIFPHAHLREDQAVLRHKRNAPADDPCRGQANEFVVAEPDRSASRFQDARDRHHQRRLAGAVGAEQAGNAPVLDLQ